MFIENIRHVRETEEKARGIVEKARMDAKNIIKKAGESSRKMETDMKARLQEYTEKKNNEAETKAEQKIGELKLKNEELKKQIKSKALKKFDEVSQYVYEQLLLI